MKYSIIFIIILVSACNPKEIPKEQLSQYNLNNNYVFNDNELEVQLKNTLKCPVRIWVQSSDLKVKKYFDQFNPITLKPLADSIIKVKIKNIESKEIKFASRLGDINQKIKTNKVELPFPKNKAYKLIQGYNSSPTHNTNWSRHALDFGLSVGDTICSATQGYVVGVIEDYKFGGKGKEWKDYGNFITIHDDSTGLFTQYVHLKHKGSLVKIGDKVNAGQNIGISGVTGRTNIEHLHFNCLKPNQSQDGLRSIPMDSIGNYNISNLKRNQKIKNYN